MDPEVLAGIMEDSLLHLLQGKDGVNPGSLIKIIRKAEKIDPIEVRANNRLFYLRSTVSALIQRRSVDREVWLEMRRLSRHGKRVAARFKELEMQRWFGVMFNTTSAYLELPGDGDHKSEAYSLI